MRLAVLIVIAFAATWFGLVETGWMDPRPVQRFLFIGHSLTYNNDMPAMVAKMADSAGSQIRYDITMQALPNATAEDHWKNAETQALLTEGDWDRLILQPEPVWRNDEAESSGLFVYGQQILAIGAAKSQPAVISDWTARDPLYRRASWSRREHFEKSQSHYRRLAQQTGAQLIDVAGIWEDVRDQARPFHLYRDDSHPTLEGSYLVALVVYAALTGMDVSGVTYVPWGMKDEDAALLRHRVKQSLDKAERVAEQAEGAVASELAASGS